MMAFSAVASVFAGTSAESISKYDAGMFGADLLRSIAVGVVAIAFLPGARVPWRSLPSRLVVLVVVHALFTALIFVAVLAALVPVAVLGVVGAVAVLAMMAWVVLRLLTLGPMALLGDDGPFTVIRSTWRRSRGTVPALFFPAIGVGILVGLGVWGLTFTDLPNWLAVALSEVLAILLIGGLTARAYHLLFRSAQTEGSSELDERPLLGVPGVLPEPSRVEWLDDEPGLRPSEPR